MLAWRFLNGLGAVPVLFALPAALALAGKVFFYRMLERPALRLFARPRPP